MIDVVWLQARGHWDMAWLEAIFAGEMVPLRGQEFRHHEPREIADMPALEGAVVVLAARWQVDHIAEIEAALQSLGWVLLVLTGDEDRSFDWRGIRHPNLSVWVQTPHPERDSEADGFVGDFWPPDCRALLEPDTERDLDFFFAGQNNSAARADCLAALEGLPNGLVAPTEIFGSGLAYPDYMALLQRTKIAPCPSGPYTPDTFRLFEALEAGCVPVVQAGSPNWGDYGYWPFLLPDAPFPIVETWAEFPDVLAFLLLDWPHQAARVGAWWQLHKRKVGLDFLATLASLGARRAESATIDDAVTVLIPTSPIPSHPSTDIIETTLASVRDRLPDAEVLVLIDGIRPEQAHMQGTYDEYRRRLVALTMRAHNVYPVMFDEHLHQAAMTRRALELVRTPMVLFVEHDTPICGDVPFEDMGRAIQTGQASVIRLYHEAAVHPEHQHLMMSEPEEVAGLRMTRTAQWSQRPHLASTKTYRELLGRYFGTDSRTMIEDVLHGVLDVWCRDYGLAGWERFKLWLYTPEGDMKRSEHLDGRQDEPKFEGQFVFSYDGPRPFGAPRPTR